MSSNIETAPAAEAAPPAALSAAESVMARDRDYVLPTYARYPLVLARGKGCYVWDVAGRRYLDLISGIGVNALGHSHPRIVKAIRNQSARLVHCSNLYHHEYQSRLAERLVKLSGLEKAFFANSGTEAVEGGLKIMRAYGHRISPEKFELVALENSFHGRSMGALSITGQPKYRRDFEPLIPGVKFVPRRDEAALEAAVSSRTAGIILEWIQGEGGIYPICSRMTRKARELADRYDALLMFDEIQCGVARPGAFFAYQLDEPPVLPDLVAAAKPLACGIPMGAILANGRAASAISPGMHGSTFGGGALACRVALECLDVMEELLPSIREVGAYFRAELRRLGETFSFVKEVRGEGLMLGMELDFPCKRSVLDAMAEGLLINCTNDTVLRFLPPYVIRMQDVDRAIRAMSKVLRKAPAGATAR